MNTTSTTTVTFQGEAQKLQLEQVSEREYEVSFMGMRLGRISSYTGSIDRNAKNSMVRIPGKPRTLWMAQSNSKESAAVQLTSRADALRHVIRFATI